jgi:TolB protein
MDADGSNQTRLVGSQAAETNAVWSPDGKQITFDTYIRTSCYAGSSVINGELYVINSDGTDKHLIRQWGYSSAWSPDGAHIAFLVSSSRFTGNNQIYVTSADGSNQERLTDNSRRIIQLAWSPDGTRIAFIASSTNLYDDLQIYVMNADGSNQTQLTNDVGAHRFSWSPDGQRIAFFYMNGDWQNATVRDIFVINADGSDPIQLTDSSQTVPQQECGFPFWSPDYSQLSVICGHVVSRSREIYIISADGSSRTKLDIHFTADDIGGAAWQP